MRVKAGLPASLLGAGQATALVQTYFEFNHLKQLYRQGWLRRGVPPERCESVAEHSFGVATLAMFLAGTLPEVVDPARVVRMALVHDFGEIYAGDVIPSDAMPPEEKQRLERASVEQVLSRLPDGAEYVALWEEFEQGQTAEARLVRQLDRLEMGLQAAVYHAQGLIDPAEFYASVEQALSSVELRALLAELQALVRP